MPVCQRIAVRSTKRGPWGRKYGSFCGAESFFLPGEVIFEIVRSRFASSAILESRINGQELVNGEMAQEDIDLAHLKKMFSSRS